MKIKNWNKLENLKVTPSGIHGAPAKNNPISIN